jgi:hypothetical protein
MGFNRRKLEDQRRDAAEKVAASRRATEAQILEDAERLVTAWNERQAKRMPMLFSPTIGAAITAGYWFLWVRCPACRTINAIDLRGLDRHPDAMVSSLIPAVVPLMSAECAVRRARTIVANEASPMKCGKNIVVVCWANERPQEHAALSPHAFRHDRLTIEFAARPSARRLFSLPQLAATNCPSAWQ